MSSTPPPPPLKPSRRPSPPPPRDDYRASPKSGSGQHPAVKAYRDKLQSIHEHTVPKIAEIDEDLAQFLIEEPTSSPTIPVPAPPTKGPTR
jgi:hypothetical protein